MPPFRASDEQLEHEIDTLERMARLRLRRYANEMRDLDRDLSELRKERARRRASAEIPATSEPVESSA